MLNSFKKHIYKLGLLFFILLLAAVVLMALSFESTGDGFADNLHIPDNIEISDPKDITGNFMGTADSVEIAAGQDDSFQKSLLESLKPNGDEDPSITAKLGPLFNLQNKEPDILMRYLVTSPSWRVFVEDGALFATRRWKVQSHWHYNLNGYYVRNDIDRMPDTNMQDFQFRATIGFSGKPWMSSADSTQITQGDTKNLKLSNGNDMYESDAVIEGIDGLIVEIFEQSEAKERRLTKAALRYLEKELEPLSISPNLGTIKAIIPSDSIKRGEPSIDLYNSFQPGIYDSEIWVNPGEAGMIYLKAFEITKNTPLSATSLKNSTNEFIGWSGDKTELFFSNTNFIIGEGDWGKPYAARFEVWFVPNSGAPERKLTERVFRIEGWQR